MNLASLRDATGIDAAVAADSHERFEIVNKYYALPFLKKLASWLVSSKERTNFTYELTENNRRQLESMVSFICGRSPSEIRGFVHELLEDQELQAHHAGMAAEIANMDKRLRPGRRIVWYALIRALKPRCVVETGVDKGLGSIVICAALARNSAEGSPGRYFGTDINPKAGGLLRAPYNEHGTILYGDSIKSLEKLDDQIDIFVNDSDHSADYEFREYETVKEKLSGGGIILGDNSHVTDKLCEFAHSNGRAFLFASEAPKDHWYPGAGVGIAFPMTGAKPFQ